MTCGDVCLSAIKVELFAVGVPVRSASTSGWGHRSGPVGDPPECHKDDPRIEQHGPALDVFAIELDTLCQLLDRCQLSAQTVHLRPPGYAGFDPVAGGVIVDG